MEKKINIYKLNDPKLSQDEIEYWKNISPDEKLNQIQILREQYIKLFNQQKLYDESRKGLRRVYKVTKLS